MAAIRMPVVFIPALLSDDAMYREVIEQLDEAVEAQVMVLSEPTMQANVETVLAKAHLADLFDRTARTSIELHGGIGYTWEYDLQLWFRRAMFDRAFLGESSYHRRRAADLAGW